MTLERQRKTSLYVKRILHPPSKEPQVGCQQSILKKSSLYSSSLPTIKRTSERLTILFTESISASQSISQVPPIYLKYWSIMNRHRSNLASESVQLSWHILVQKLDLKVALVGPGGCGKSALATRILARSFQENLTFNVSIKVNKEYILIFWVVSRPGPQSFTSRALSWIQCKLGKHYSWKKVTLPLESNPEPTPIRGDWLPIFWKAKQSSRIGHSSITHYLTKDWTNPNPWYCLGDT